jgi:endonuclease-3
MGILRKQETPHPAVGTPHLWDVSPRQAIEIQQELRKKVKIQALKRVVRRVGGADISFNLGSNVAYAVFVVLDLKTLTQVNSSYYIGPLQFPYIPGLLSFREIPLLMEAWTRLETKPDLVMLDGQGIAHPRGLGIASHFGILAGIPTLGCAKSRLVGSYQEPASQAKSYSKLVYKGETVGFAYRTKENVSPIFVSPGHLISFSDVIKILGSIRSPYRIPEPTRQAHILANDIRRKFSDSKVISLPHRTETKTKKPFYIHDVIEKVRRTVQHHPKAALFELASRGYDSLFQQLIACVISIRTRDEVALPASLALLGLAETPEDLLRIPIDDIDRAISTSTYHLQKAYRIRRIAQIAQEEFKSNLPCDRSVIESLPGIGPKCASLALGISCGLPSIAVDVHVYRVTRRWGYIKSSTPKQAAFELEHKLEKKYWIELNALLVPFGKHICTGLLPQCSKCPVLEMCQQVGVKAHR